MSDEQYRNIITQINKIYPLVIIPLGTIGNILALLVYTRKNFWHTPFGFYNSCLLIVDSLILYVGALKFPLIAFDIINLTTHSEFTCKFFTAGIYILPQFSSWILVLISFERLVVIRSFRILFYVKKRSFQFISIVLIFLIILLINFPNIIYLKVKQKEGYYPNSTNTPNNSRCEMVDSIIDHHTRDIIDLLAYTLSPFILMTTCSILISITIIKSRRKFKRKLRSLRKEYQLSFTLIFTNLVFLILNSPICVIMVIKSSRKTDEYNSKLELAYTIGNILAYINFSISVLINFVINRMFTKQFMKMFCLDSARSNSHLAMAGENNNYNNANT